ncbi:MAG: hypothetical protein WC592_07890 [Candidatus Omnitrophota bacterium]|nr:hypothetical protein [Candidatus Omnitrophota bacterium]
MAKKKKVKAKARKAKSRVKKTVKRPKAVKTRSRKVASRKARKVVKKMPEITLEKIGEVTHYFPHVKAAAVLILKDSLSVGDQIYIKGHTTDFKEKVNSMQMDRVSIQIGAKGQEIGLLVKKRVRIGDSVYKV